MAKPKADPGMVISLFPFLSILACLIGALVLMIVIQTISQTEKIDGRTEDEVRRAEEFLALEKQLAQDNATLEEIQVFIDERQKAEAELAETRERNVLLRGTLNITAGDKEAKERQHAELQQILENMLADLQVWKTEKPPLEEQIKELEAQLAELNKEPDDTPPPVIVMPSGSGSPPGTKYFFAEVGGFGIKVLRSFDENLKPTDIIRVNGGAVGVNEDLNTWLDEVANVPKSQIILLIRDGGHWASTNLRNYAMSPDHPYAIPVARLPLPGEGDADLNAFSDLIGTLPPRDKTPAPAPPAPEGGGAQ